MGGYNGSGGADSRSSATSVSLLCRQKGPKYPHVVSVLNYIL